MKQTTFVKKHLRMLADTTTPVNLYLQLRDKFPGAFLLESSDYHGNENSYSFICFDIIARIEYSKEQLKIQKPGETLQIKGSINAKEAVEQLKAFSQSLQVKDDKVTDHLPCGLFGYMSFESVKGFEDITFIKQEAEVPLFSYSFFRYIIAINHFNNELYLLELLQTGEASGIERVQTLLQKQSGSTYSFNAAVEEQSNYNDEGFSNILAKAKEHIYRGDVFQLVLSRRFSRAYKGDDFNVYRALRSINPSPYLFYFDFGSFRIFGSSPEAQLRVQNLTASVFPIAGTFKRSGNDVQDALIAEELKNDPKENAEHVMLVDLARNDLSKRGTEVNVKSFKQIQYYSHVIHLVSEVQARLDVKEQSMDVLADTFPAGTLSGAPKYKAMQLIDQYENRARGIYGGCIGFFDSKGNFNHAIIIRSFLSKDNTLYYQAGAGVVVHSKIENELQEVHNKVSALRKAIETANNL